MWGEGCLSSKMGYREAASVTLILKFLESHGLAGQLRNGRGLMVCFSPFPFPQCTQPGAPGEGLGPVQHHPLQEWPKAAAGGLCQPPFLRHQGLCDHPRGHSQVMGHKGMRAEEMAPVPLPSTFLSLPCGSQEPWVQVLLQLLLHSVNLGKSLPFLDLGFLSVK